MIQKSGEEWCHNLFHMKNMKWKYDKMNEIISVSYEKKSHTLIFIQQMIQSWEKNEVRKYFIWNRIVSYENTRMKISCFHICSWKNKQFTYRHIIFLILFRDQQFFNVNNNPTNDSKVRRRMTSQFISYEIYIVSYEKYEMKIW